MNEMGELFRAASQLRKSRCCIFVMMRSPKQAKEIVGYVRNGEQGSPVVFWKWLEKDDARQSKEETGTDSRRIPLARLYSVFNV